MAETTRVVVNTLYADPDNDPPNSDAIAFPKSDGNPTWHNGTGGTGTYKDPITFAADPRDFPKGTLIYVPDLRAYFGMEDTCSNCIADRTAGRPTKIDFFAGGKGQSFATMERYESQLTINNRTIIVNPDPGKNVIVGPLFDTGRKSTGNPAGVPDTSHLGNGGQPPAETVIMQLPKIFGWGGEPWVRNDSVLSFSGGDLRVDGTGWPAAQIVQPVAAGRQYRVNASFLDNSGWLKVTNPANDSELAGVYEVSGPQSLTFTAAANEVFIWAGRAGDGGVRVQDLTVTQL